MLNETRTSNQPNTLSGPIARNTLKSPWRRIARAATATLTIVLMAQQPAYAHKPSDSYLTLTPHESQVSLRWDVALRDLDAAIGLDRDDDGMLTWGEVRQRQRDIVAEVMPQMEVRSGTQRCTALQTPTLQLDGHSDGTYAVLQTELTCGGASVLALHLDYRLFATLDPTHRGIVRIVGATEHTAVLGPQQSSWDITLGRAAPWSVLRSYVVEGVGHIWAGYDHLLFLLALLLPSVLVRRPDASGRMRWQGAAAHRTPLLDVLKIVTAFTVAHSITLTVAVLDVVALPSRWVEAAIALTVALAALNNLWPVMRERRWLAAFVFGLIHGFGFAGALQELGLPAGSLALALLGFNVGVEVGQLAIVALFFPLAYLLRMSAGYQRGVLQFGSCATLALALAWFTERVFDVSLVGF